MKDLRIAFLVENWGPPWNEGYKNLAKYIFDMLKDGISIKVFTYNEPLRNTWKDYDLIYVFNYPHTLSTLLSFIPLRKRIIKEVAKKELDTDVGTLIKSFLIGKMFWRSVIATSKLLEYELKRLLGAHKHVYYLPPPIPTDYFKPLDPDRSRQVLGLESNKFYIGYTGTLNRYRRLDLLINAMKLLGKNNNLELLLSITNVNNANQQLLMKELRRIKTISVRLVNVKDVRIFYSAVDLLVYPVEREGAVEPPLTVLEAMSCGVPVVAYKTPVTQMLINNLVDGFLFKDHTELASIIKTMLVGEIDKNEIKRNARIKIISRFGNKILKEKYLKTLEKLVLLNSM